MPRDDYPLSFTGPKYLDFRQKDQEDDSLNRLSQELALKKLAGQAVKSEVLSDVSANPIIEDSTKEMAKQEIGLRDMRKRYFKGVVMRLQDEAKNRELTDQEKDAFRTAYMGWQDIEDQSKSDEKKGLESRLKQSDLSGK